MSINELSASDADAIEQFFVDRQLAPCVELTSWAPPATIAELSRRNFVPAWFRSVFAITLRSPAAPPVSDLRIDRVDDDAMEIWLDVFAEGFGAEHGEARVISDEIARASNATPGAHTFLALMDGQPVGCGSVQIVGGVAGLGGAATIPGFRGRGVQAALVAHRMHLAAELGCDLGAATAITSGPSARNLIRLGFHHTHTQAVVEQRATFGTASAS